MQFNFQKQSTPGINDKSEDKWEINISGDKWEINMHSWPQMWSRTAACTASCMIFLLQRRWLLHKNRNEAPSATLSWTSSKCDFRWGVLCAQTRMFSYDTGTLNAEMFQRKSSTISSCFWTLPRFGAYFWKWTLHFSVASSYQGGGNNFQNQFM